MAAYALTSSTIYVGGYDISDEAHAVSGTVTTTELDVTTFASGGWHQRIAGLHDIDFQAENFLDYSGDEPSLYPLLGSTAQVVTLCPTTGAQGEPAELFQAVETDLGYPENVGDVAQYKPGFKGSSQWVRGSVLGAKTSVTSGSSTSAVSALAVGTTSKVFGTLHVFSAGTSLNVQIQSAAASNFAGATTRIQFQTTSSIGASWGTPLVGPITDTNWRINYTVSSGTFVFFAAFGVL